MNFFGFFEFFVLLADVSAFGLKPKHDQPLGLPGLLVARWRSKPFKRGLLPEQKALHWRCSNSDYFCHFSPKPLSCHSSINGKWTNTLHFFKSISDNFCHFSSKPLSNFFGFTCTFNNPLTKT
ncbi:unnamed protein product [Prunus armeniaca]